MILGRAQRRSPRAFDGGHGAGAMERFRRSPMRHGVLGLAVVGAAVPLGIARFQEGRIDPSHERLSPSAARDRAASDRAVAEAWRTLKTGRVVTNAVAGVETRVAAATDMGRETVIQRNLERFAEFKVTRQLAETIYDAASDAGIDPDVAFGLVRAESGFKSSATSHVGAIGLTQLMPKTAAWLKPGTTVRDLRNAETNARIGFGYLKNLIEKYDGNERLALLAYNRGPGTVDRVLKRGGNPDNGYADMVLEGQGH